MVDELILSQQYQLKIRHLNHQLAGVMGIIFLLPSCFEVFQGMPAEELTGANFWLLRAVVN